MTHVVRHRAWGALLGLVFLLSCQSRGQPPAADEGAMSAAVKAQLVLDMPAPNGITIEAHQGTIHLDGTVLDEAQKQQATQSAWKVPGVKEVVNNLRVVPKGATG